ncbi:MAG: flagellar basal body L-ring protein FlgH [Paraglaciecola sp.]|uniref:flagellar basal body L-ring protein FlgH n=1 Tax=Paraglaciecola sp. TaxID=1920173 RepID=UPI003299952B
MNFCFLREQGYSQLLAVFILTLILASCQTLPSSPEKEVVLDLPTSPDSQSTPLETPKEDTQVKQGDPRYRPVRVSSPQAITVPTGSLFNQNKYVGIFSHKRQYNIGDMVQVLLEEKISANKQQSLSKDNDTQLSLDPRVTAGFIRVDGNDLSINHNQSSSFSSSSDSKQSNSLNGSLNVFVNEILANGNLVVSGEKWIKLNIGSEYIRVNGELRVEDIDPDNTISSTKIGNPLIEYSGSGAPQDNQEESLIAKILSVFR